MITCEIDLTIAELMTSSEEVSDYVRDKLQEAGMPINEENQLTSGVLAWADLDDKPVRRYIWNGQ